MLMDDPWVAAYAPQARWLRSCTCFDVSGCSCRCQAPAAFPNFSCRGTLWQVRQSGLLTQRTAKCSIHH